MKKPKRARQKCGGEVHYVYWRDFAITSPLTQGSHDWLRNNRRIDSIRRRQRAYVVESDPLFLEWQYEKTAAAEQAWRDKVAEIKLRYPVARGAEE